MLLAAVVLVGCGQRTDTSADRDGSPLRSDSYRQQSAKEFLAAVLARYRNASSYHDSAIVRISHESDGRLESQVAPLNVWFDHQRLCVDAYDVRLWSDRDAVTAWILDPSSDDFDSQVLRMAPINHRPDLESLLADPILAERLAAGLAGPPPQLEWLFAAEPMKHLFDGDHRFEFGKRHDVGGHPCLAIRVDATGDRYQFWIDERLGLIRRVDLPPVVVSSLSSESAKSMSLSLELMDASFDLPQRDPSLAPLPTRPKFVRRFVALPAQEPTPQLGTRSSETFRRTDIHSRFVISEQGSDRPVTVLMRFTGDEQSIASAMTLQRWTAMMSSPLRDRVRVVLAVDDRAAVTIPRSLNLPVVVDSGGVLGGGYRLTSGSLVVLAPGGAVAWTQSELTAQDLVLFGAIVGDVLDGVDVPKRVREQWEASIKAYRSRLMEQRIPVK